MSLPFETYKSGEYLAKNPTWDIEDSAWKAGQVRKILARNSISPSSIVEVGCGAGGILASLHDESPDIRYVGFEIAPDASRFWGKYKEKNISFVIDDFLTADTPHFEVLLLLDVVEHVPDPFAFLRALRGRADYFVFHFPLDLSAVSVLREKPLLNVREKVGHIHYFTKGLALSLIYESGFEVLNWNYTGAAFSAPQLTWKSRLAGNHPLA
jgi:SAM-dependent methyltransferase